MRTFIALLFIVSSTIGSAGAAGMLVPLDEVFEGNHLSLYLDPKELDALPKWNPGDKEPPLGVAEALTRFRAWLGENAPEYDDVEYEEIALKSVRRRDGSRFWHYLIRYNGVAKGYVIHKPEQFAAVLFDGKVVPAVLERHPLD